SIDGFASLAGDLEVVLVGEGEDERIFVSGSNVSALMSAGSVELTVTDADFALLIGDGSYALQAEGSVALEGLPGVNFSGEMSVWVNTTGEQEVDFGENFGVVDYGTTNDSFRFRGDNLSLAIDGFVNVSGNFIAAFVVDGANESILITAGDVIASLSVGDIELTISEAAFALSATVAAGSPVYALHAEGELSLTGVSGLSFGGRLEVWVNTTGEQIVDFGEYGEIDYQTRDTQFAFRGADLDFAIDGFASLSGDLTILYLVDGEDESLLITGENLSALLGVAPIAISVSDATFGLLLYNKEDVAVYALHAEG
ncbi:hypothetical protein, partial [Limnospira sp. PMC 1306.21]|uniref:hypothetical protein n=2 Tax=unclassified Limnospira TaxID=2642885 RepID=UPI0028E14641